MKTLKIISWRAGLDTISLVQAMKEYSTGSLVAAKSEAGRLLDGEIVELTFETESRRE